MSTVRLDEDASNDASNSESAIIRRWPERREKIWYGSWAVLGKKSSGVGGM
jgi:hypothetical protein